MDLMRAYDIFCTIFADASDVELVKVWSKTNDKCEFHKVSYLKSLSHFKRVLSQFPSEDTYISFNSFKNRKKGRATMNDLFNVYAFCVDVDYKRGKDSDCDIREAIAQAILSDGFLRPAYIEYGNQFRLVYLLKGHLSGKKQFEAISLVARRLVETLNKNKDFDFCAEYQGLNSFIRVAGSVNTKASSDKQKGAWVYKDGDFCYSPTAYPTISYLEIDGESSRKTLSEYMDIVLGEFKQPDWYESWKKSSKQQTQKVASSQTLNRKRLDDIDILRDYFCANRGDTGFRDKLCFLHYIHAKLLYGSDEKAWDSLCVFNAGLTHPLLEKELNNCISSARTKRYTMTNSTFVKFLNLTDEELALLPISVGAGLKEDNKEYCKRYYKKKRKTMVSKKSKIERKKQSILKLRKQKKTNRQICSSLHMTPKTLERYVSDLIREHKLWLINLLLMLLTVQELKETRHYEIRIKVSRLRNHKHPMRPMKLIRSKRMLNNKLKRLLLLSKKGHSFIWGCLLLPFFV